MTISGVFIGALIGVVKSFFLRRAPDGGSDTKPCLRRASHTEPGKWLFRRFNYHFDIVAKSSTDWATTVSHPLPHSSRKLLGGSQKSKQGGP
jgi:hypothetical protein